jgi:hypothetical protein
MEVDMPGNHKKQAEGLAAGRRYTAGSYTEKTDGSRPAATRYTDQKHVRGRIDRQRQALTKPQHRPSEKSSFTVLDMGSTSVKAWVERSEAQDLQANTRGAESDK